MRREGLAGELNRGNATERFHGLAFPKSERSKKPWQNNNQQQQPTTSNRAEYIPLRSTYTEYQPHYKVKSIELHNS
jgi:hypothetical protein